MREEIANLVHPVISYGLRLKDRLEKGERLDLESEQAAVKSLLSAANGARRFEEFSGDGVEPALVPGLAATAKGGLGGSEHFLGAYALVCWLDEIFILDSPWKQVWNEKKLEESLYGTNERAWNFWEQARRAESRRGNDALEVFYLCVMLGFRGDLRFKPQDLEKWRRTVERRLEKGQRQEWEGPPEQEPPIHVPPLRGRDRLQRMIVIVCVLLGLLIPAATCYLVLKLQ